MAASTTIPAASGGPQKGSAVAGWRRDAIRHPAVESLDVAHVLRTVGDPLRLEIVRALADGGEQLCGTLADELGVPKSTTSYHLRLLREAGVTRVRAKGTLRYVSLRGDDLELRFPGLLAVLTAPTDR